MTSRDFGISEERPRSPGFIGRPTYAGAARDLLSSCLQLSAVETTDRSNSGFILPQEECVAMKITLLGAAGGEVTGSAYLLQTADANVMVDCGLFQGAQKLENSNRLPSSSSLKQLHAVVLTHAHLDPTGRLPLLARFDYSGNWLGSLAPARHPHARRGWTAEGGRR
jgi:hypothetical protein